MLTKEQIRIMGNRLAVLFSDIKRTSMVRERIREFFDRGMHKVIASAYITSLFLQILIDLYYHTPLTFKSFIIPDISFYMAVFILMYVYIGLYYRKPEN